MNIRKIFSCGAFAVIFMLAFATCDDGTGGGGNPFVGTWTGSGLTIEFTSAGRFTISNSSASYSGTYTWSSNTATLTYNSGGTIAAVISGNTLSFSGYNYTLTRGGPGGHTHTYSTYWMGNATQHWHECTAYDGAKIDIANHTGNPCTVCVTFFVYWTAVTNSTIWDYQLGGYTLKATIYAIAYGNNQWVTVGNYGRMATSTDSTTWTAVSGSNSTFYVDHIYAIAYGNGGWVAVGENGSRATSSDGTTWKGWTSSAFGTSTIYGIAYGGGKWVAGGYGGKMAYSTN